MKGLPLPGPRTSRTADSPLIRPVLPGGTPPWAAGPPKPGPNIREFEVEIEEEVPVNTNPQVPEDVVKKYDEVMDEMKRVRGALGKRARRKRLLKFTEDITDDEADGPDGSGHGSYSLDRSRGDRHPYGETASIYSLDAPVSNGELERIVAESDPIDKFLSNSAPVTPSPTIQVFENLIVPVSEAEAEPTSTNALETPINATERLRVSPSATLAVRSTADLNARTSAHSTVASPVHNPVTLDHHLAISTCRSTASSVLAASPQPATSVELPTGPTSPALQRVPLSPARSPSHSMISAPISVSEGPLESVTQGSPIPSPRPSNSLVVENAQPEGHVVPSLTYHARSPAVVVPENDPQPRAVTPAPVPSPRTVSPILAVDSNSLTTPEPASTSTLDPDFEGRPGEMAPASASQGWSHSSESLTSPGLSPMATTRPAAIYDLPGFAEAPPVAFLEQPIAHHERSAPSPYSEGSTGSLHSERVENPVPLVPAPWDDQRSDELAPSPATLDHLPYQSGADRALSPVAITDVSSHANSPQSTPNLGRSPSPLKLGHQPNPALPLSESTSTTSDPNEVPTDAAFNGPSAAEQGLLSPPRIPFATSTPHSPRQPPTPMTAVSPAAEIATLTKSPRKVKSPFIGQGILNRIQSKVVRKPLGNRSPIPPAPIATPSAVPPEDTNLEPATQPIPVPIVRPTLPHLHIDASGVLTVDLVRSKALSPVYHRTIPASQSSDLIETELERELMPMGLSPVDIPTSWFRSQPSTPRLFQVGPPKKLSVRNFTETDETSPTSPVILAQSLPTTQVVTQRPLPVVSGTNVTAAEVHVAAQSTPVSPVGRVPIDRAPTFSPGPVLARITVRPAPLAGLVNSPTGLSSPRSRQGSRSTIAVPLPLSPKTPAGEIKEVFESFNAANTPPAPTPLPVSPFQFADADLQAAAPPSSATTTTSPHLTDDALSTLSEMASTHPTAVLRHVQQQHSAVNNIRPPASPLGTPSLLRTLSHRQRSHSASIASEHSFGVGSSFGHPSGSASRSSIPSSVVLTGVAEEEGDGEPVNTRAQPTVVRLRRSCEVPISKPRAPSPPLSRSIPAVLHTAPTIAAFPITRANDRASPPYQVSPLPSPPAPTAMSDCVAVSRVTPPRIQTAQTVIASTPGSPHPFSPSDAVGLDLDPSGSPVLQAQYPTTSFVESSLALSDAALSFSDFEPVDPTHNEYPTGYAPAPSASRNHAFLSPALLGYQPNLGRPLRYSGTLPRKSNSTFASDYSQFSGGATSPPPATHVSLDIAREIAALDDQLVEFRTRRAGSVSRSRADSQGRADAPSHMSLETSGEGERDHSALNFPAYDDAIAQVLASEAYTPHQQAAQIAEALDALLEDHARARGPGTAASDSPTSRPSSPDQSVGTGSPTGLGLTNLTCHPDPSPLTSPELTSQSQSLASEIIPPPAVPLPIPARGLSGVVPYDIDQAAREEEVDEGAEARLSTHIPSSPPSAPRLKSAVPTSAGADDPSPSHPILEDYMPLAIPVHFQRLRSPTYSDQRHAGPPVPPTSGSATPSPTPPPKPKVHLGRPATNGTPRLSVTTTNLARRRPTLSHPSSLEASPAAMPPVSSSSTTRSDESAGRRSSTISRPRNSPCAARSLLQSLESELNQELKKLRQSGDSASSPANDRPVLSPPFELPVERPRATGIDRAYISRSNAAGDWVELPEERSVVSPVSSVVSARSLASPIFRMSLDAAPTPTAPRRSSVTSASSAAGEKAHRAAGPSGLSSSITSLESIMSVISADRASLASHSTSVAQIVSPTDSTGLAKPHSRSSQRGETIHHHHRPSPDTVRPVVSLADSAVSPFPGLTGTTGHRPGPFHHRTRSGSPELAMPEVFPLGTLASSLPAGANGASSHISETSPRNTAASLSLVPAASYASLAESAAASSTNSTGETGQRAGSSPRDGNVSMPTELATSDLPWAASATSSPTGSIGAESHQSESPRRTVAPNVPFEPATADVSPVASATSSPTGFMGGTSRDSGSSHHDETTSMSPERAMLAASPPAGSTGESSRPSESSPRNAAAHVPLEPAASYVPAVPSATSSFASSTREISLSSGPLHPDGIMSASPKLAKRGAPLATPVELMPAGFTEDASHHPPFFHHDGITSVSLEPAVSHVSLPESAASPPARSTRVMGRHPDSSHFDEAMSASSEPAMSDISSAESATSSPAKPTEVAGHRWGSPLRSTTTNVSFEPAMPPDVPSAVSSTPLTVSSTSLNSLRSESPHHDGTISVSVEPAIPDGPLEVSATLSHNGPLQVESPHWVSPRRVTAPNETLEPVVASASSTASTTSLSENSRGVKGHHSESPQHASIDRVSPEVAMPSVSSVASATSSPTGSTGETGQRVGSSPRDGNVSMPTELATSDLPWAASATSSPAGSIGAESHQSESPRRTVAPNVPFEPATADVSPVASATSSPTGFMEVTSRDSGSSHHAVAMSASPEPAMSDNSSAKSTISSPAKPTEVAGHRSGSPLRSTATNVSLKLAMSDVPSATSAASWSAGSTEEISHPSEASPRNTATSLSPAPAPSNLSLAESVESSPADSTRQINRRSEASHHDRAMNVSPGLAASDVLSVSSAAPSLASSVREIGPCSESSHRDGTMDVALEPAIPDDPLMVSATSSPAGANGETSRCSGTPRRIMAANGPIAPAILEGATVIPAASSPTHSAGDASRQLEPLHCNESANLPPSLIRPQVAMVTTDKSLSTCPADFPSRRSGSPSFDEAVCVSPQAVASDSLGWESKEILPGHAPFEAKVYPTTDAAVGRARCQIDQEEPTSSHLSSMSTTTIPSLPSSSATRELGAGASSLTVSASPEHFAGHTTRPPSTGQRSPGEHLPTLGQPPSSEPTVGPSDSRLSRSRPAAKLDQLMADLVAFADPTVVLSQPDSASPKARAELNSVPRFSLETVTPPQRPFPKLPVSDDGPDLEPTSRSSSLDEPHHVPSQDADPLSHRGATYPQRSAIVQPYAPLSSSPAFPLEIKTSPESITLANPTPLPPSPIGPPKTTSPIHKPPSHHDRLVGSLPKPSPIDEALQRCEFSDQSRVVQVAPFASELTSDSIDEPPATQPRPSLQSLRSTFSYARTCSISSLDLSPELTPEQLGLMTRVPPLAAVLNPPVRIAAPHLGSMMYPSSPHTVVSQALYPPGPDTFDQSLPVEQNILPEYSSSEFQSQSELDSATSNSDSGHDGSLDDEDDDDEDEAFEIIASHTSSFVESRCSEDRIIGLQKATRVCLSTQSPAGAFPMILTRGSPGPSGYSTPQFHSHRGSALSSLRPPLASSLPDIPPPLLAGATPIAQQLAGIDHQTTERFCDAASDRSATSPASSSFPALPVVQVPQDSVGSSHLRLDVAESAVIPLSPVINSHSSQQSVILARSPVRVAHATVHLSLPTRSSFSPPRSPGQSGETLTVRPSPVQSSNDSSHATPSNETETSPVASAAASTLPPRISVSPSVSQHRLTPEKRTIIQPNVQLPTPRRSDDGMASKPDAVPVQITTSPPTSVQVEQRTAVAFRSTPSLTARLQEAPTATVPASAAQRTSLKTDAPNRPDPTRAGPSSSAHRKGLPSFLAPASAVTLESHRTSLGTRTPGQSPPRSLYVPDRLSTISMGAWSDMAQDQAYAAVLSYEWNQMQPRFSAAPSATPPRPSEPPLHGHDDAFTGFESFMAFSFSDDPPSRPTSTGHLSPFRLDGAHTGRRADVAARLRHLAPADVIASSNELAAPTVPPPPPTRAPPPGKPAAGSWTTSLSSWWSSKAPATPAPAQPTPAVTVTAGPVVRKRPKLSHAHFGRQLCDEVLYLQGERSATAGAGNWTRLWKTRRTRQLFMFSLDLPLNLDEVHSASLGRMIPRAGGALNQPGHHRVGSATANRTTSTILPERFTAQHRPAVPAAATTAAVALPPLSTSQLSGGSSGAPTPTSGYSPNSSVLALTYTAPMVSLDIENIRRLCSEPQGVLAFLSASELAYLVDHLNLTRKAIKIQTQHFEGKSEQLRNQIATNRAMITDLQPRAAAADPSQLSLPRRRIVVGPSPLLPTSPMSTHDASIASSAARSPFSPTVSSSGWPGSPHQTADAGLYFYQGTAAKQMHHSHGHGHHHLPSPRSNVTTPGFSPGGPASSTTYPPTTSAGRMSGGIFRVEDEPLASPSPVLSTASRASTSSSISSHHHHHHPRPRVSDLSTLRPTLTKRPVVYVSHQP